MNWHTLSIIALAIWIYIGWIGLVLSLCKAAGKPTPKP